MTSVSGEQIVWGRVQASAHCRLTNPLVKIGVLLLPLVAGIRATGVQYPGPGSPDLTAYLHQLSLLVEVILIVHLISHLDTREGHRKRSLIHALVGGGALYAIHALSDERLAYLVDLFGRTSLGSFVEPVQFFVFASFAYTIPIVRAISVRDSLWLGHMATFGRRARLAAIYFAVVFIYFFVQQTFGPKFRGVVLASTRNWRLLSKRSIRDRYSSLSAGFGCLFITHINALMQEGFSLMKERGFLGRIYNDQLGRRLASEDLFAIVFLAHSLGIVFEVIPNVFWSIPGAGSIH